MRFPRNGGKGSCVCPACGKYMAPHSIHSHTTTCDLWKEKYGEPFPHFKKNVSPKLFQPDLVEGLDYIQCKVCLEYGWDFRFRRLLQHIEGHSLAEDSYLAKYPGAAIRLKDTLQRRKASVKARWGVENVFQAEEVKTKIRKSMVEHFGVENPAYAKEIVEKREQTNLQRYGAKNVFASPIIKERIRGVWQTRHGVDNPTQVPEIMGKRMQTNLERYGVEHYLQTQEFQEKYKITSQERFGTDHPMQSEEGRKLCEEGCMASLGVPYSFLDPGVQKRAYESNLENHGGVHHMQTPEVLERRKQTTLRLYGVDNVSKVPEIKEKIIRILKERWDSGAVPEINKLEAKVNEVTPNRVVFH